MQSIAWFIFSQLYDDFSEVCDSCLNIFLDNALGALGAFDLIKISDLSLGKKTRMIGVQ